MLDGSPGYSMGAELLIAPGARLKPIVELEDEISEMSPQDLVSPSSLVGRLPDNLLKLAKYAGRAGINGFEFVQSAHKFLNSSFFDWSSRYEFASDLICQRAQREGAAMAGFKWNSKSPVQLFSKHENARLLVIVRHPEQVIQSQIRRGFKKHANQIWADWQKTIATSDQLRELFPNRVSVVRYEDLVSEPVKVLQGHLELLGLPFDREMVAFEKSDGQILNSRHNNEIHLRRGIQKPSVDWRKEAVQMPQSLPEKLQKDVSSALESAGFLNALEKQADKPGDKLVGCEKLAWGLIRHEKLLWPDFSSKRRYHAIDYESLIAELAPNHQITTLRQYIDTGHKPGQSYLLIRHDIDHDIENAVRIARWEHSAGIQSTFCVLHTAWYYGAFKGYSYQHSKLVVESMLKIQELGHEVNFHNNLVTLGLTTGAHPGRILVEELEFLRGKEIDVVGTSTHGDALCKELGFRNFELFYETIGSKFGGRRNLVLPGSSHPPVKLGVLPMSEFDLSYEAYDLYRDKYITDSGGTLRTRFNAAGRRYFGRQPNDGSVVGLLTHPIWWHGF